MNCTVCGGDLPSHWSNCPTLFNEEACAKRVDGHHCDCWYDGEKCCACGAPAMSDDEKRAQGMDTTPERRGAS